MDFGKLLGEYMKKIDRLFVSFPELKMIEQWIRTSISTNNKHPIKRVYKRYTLRKPKFLDKAVKIFREGSSNFGERLWSPMYLDHYYWGSLLFEHLNICFSKLKNVNGFNNLLKNLKNTEQFFDTISEIEFNAYFAKRYSLDLEPKIESSEKITKKLDSKVGLSKRGVYFEIITPKMSKKLESGKVVVLENRAKYKILDKLDTQIKPILDKINKPLVIVVNTSHSDIDEIDIEDALLGQSQYTFYIPNDRNAVIPDAHISRKNNSINDKYSYGNIISAIIVYRSKKHLWGFDFKKEITLNKNALYPLTSEEYKRLNRFNLTKI